MTLNAFLMSIDFRAQRGGTSMLCAIRQFFFFFILGDVTVFGNFDKVIAIDKFGVTVKVRDAESTGSAGLTSQYFY